jgi:hypothetical protein
LTFCTQKIYNFNIFNLNTIIVQSMQGQSLDYYHWPVYKYVLSIFNVEKQGTILSWTFEFMILNKTYKYFGKKCWYSIYEKVFNNLTFSFKWRLIVIISSERNTKITLLILLIANYKSGILSLKAWTLKIILKFHVLYITVSFFNQICYLFISIEM